MWKSKMQKTTALSTAEAECYAASTAASEVLYLRKLLKRMGFVQASPTPVYSFCHAPQGEPSSSPRHEGAGPPSTLGGGVLSKAAGV